MLSVKLGYDKRDCYYRDIKKQYPKKIYYVKYVFIEMKDILLERFSTIIKILVTIVIVMNILVHILIRILT